MVKSELIYVLWYFSKHILLFCSLVMFTLSYVYIPQSCSLWCSIQNLILPLMPWILLKTWATILRLPSTGNTKLLILSPSKIWWLTQLFAILFMQTAFVLSVFSNVTCLLPRNKFLFLPIHVPQLQNAALNTSSGKPAATHTDAALFLLPSVLLNPICLHPFPSADIFQIFTSACYPTLYMFSSMR